MLEKLAESCFRRRRLVLGLWVVLLVGLGVAQGAIGSNFHTEFRLPNTESKRGFEILQDNFPQQQTSGDASVVFRAEQGIDDPTVKATMTSMFDQMRSIPGIEVRSPYAPGGERQISENRQIAYASVGFPLDYSQGDFQDAAETTRALIPEGIDGLQVEFGGEAFAEFEPPSSEAIGLAFAVFILILAFGSVLAMGLPIGVALVGIGTGTALITLAQPRHDHARLHHAAGGDDRARRRHRLRPVHRHPLPGGPPPRPRSARTPPSPRIDTAGRAVIFAGITVVISLLGMLADGPGVRQRVGHRRRRSPC